MSNSEIVSGLYLVDKIRGGNVYLLVNDELVLIDTGMPGNAGQILKFIKKLGRDPNELVCVIITHSHIDHMGSLSELQALTKFKTLAHENEMMLSSGSKYILSPHLEGIRGIFIKLLVLTCPRR